MWRFILVLDAVVAQVTVPLQGCTVSTVNQDNDLVKAPVYYGQVTVSARQTSFQLLFDTGSSQLWLPSSFCRDVACAFHQRFESSLPPLENDTFEGKKSYFASGELTGFAVKDQLCLGSLCAKLVPIMAATEESEYPFVDMPFDGILGLGPSLDGPIRALQQHGISAFAFQLGAPNCSLTGQAAFGALDNLPLWAMPEGVMWAPLMAEAEEEGYWMLEMVSMSVGGHIVQTCDQSPNACRAAIDTGTGDIIGPQDVVWPLLDILDTKDCHMQALPKIEFHLQGTERIFTLTLDPWDYVDESSNWGRCDLRLTSMDFGKKPEMWVLGQPVLRKYTSVFDLQHRMVGFGAQSHRSRSMQRPKLRASVRGKRVTVV